MVFLKYKFAGHIPEGLFSNFCGDSAREGTMTFGCQSEFPNSIRPLLLLLRINNLQPKHNQAHRLLLPKLHLRVPLILNLVHNTRHLIQIRISTLTLLLLLLLLFRTLLTLDRMLAQIRLSVYTLMRTLTLTLLALLTRKTLMYALLSLSLSFAC